MEPHPSTARPKGGLRPSQDSFLLLAVTLIFRQIVGTRPSMLRPTMDMPQSRRICLQRAVMSISRRSADLLRCNLLSARGMPESPR
jgi:hypothetical protein